MTAGGRGPNASTSAAPARIGIVGVLIAAGRSRRMGRQKLLLPWPPPDGPSTVIASAFDLIRPHCERMIVVLGDDDVGTAIPHTFDRVRGAPEGDMLDSIRIGLEAARGARIVLLQPADHPAASPATVLRVIESMQSAAADPAPLIAAMPEHHGRGGHPVAIRGSGIDAILLWRGPDGLAGYWRRIAASVKRLPVDDPSCIRDLDRPEDYP